jgi:carbon-monoxide dehydrogenase small subunit
MTVDLAVTVNGRPRNVAVEAHHTLLEVLRTDLGLTGTKECCLVGECGACTVILDGRSVDSCMVLAVEADGAAITTVEGLARDGALDPLQTAFLDHGAAQCGFCIPGQLVSARALLASTPHPTRAQVEDGLAGNLCRCAGYEQIIEAVLDAAGTSARGGAVAGVAGAVTGDAGTIGVSGVSTGGAGTSVTGGGADVRGPDPASTPDARIAPQ